VDLMLPFLSFTCELGVEDGTEHLHQLMDCHVFCDLDKIPLLFKVQSQNRLSEVEGLKVLVHGIRYVHL
jgi:hypothetical protein